MPRATTGCAPSSKPATKREAATATASSVRPTPPPRSKRESAPRPPPRPRSRPPASHHKGNLATALPARPFLLRRPFLFLARPRRSPLIPLVSSYWGESRQPEPTPNPLSSYFYPPP